MAVPEETFLEPKDPTVLNSDEWAIFPLRKVKVVSQDSGELVSLLSANKDHPVKVTGQLQEIEEDYQYLVRNAGYEKKTIELKSVTTYAFAEYQDGSYGFWAAGKAGWFELESSASAYQPISNQMSEATALLYFLADRLRRATNPKPRWNAKEQDKYVIRVFRDYLSQAGNPARFADVADVREAFHEHRIFLITSMLEGQEGVDWIDTPLYLYFKHNYPEDVKNLTLRIKPSSIVPEPMETKMEGVGAIGKSKLESSLVGDTKPKKKGRPPKKPPAQPPATPTAKRQRESDSSEQAEDESYDDPDVINRKRKSILRPSGGKSAKKAKTAAGRQRSLPALDEGGNSDGDNWEEATPPSGESPITTIKNGEHLDLITNPQSEQISQDESPPPRYRPRKYLELSVAEYEIPSIQPQGPGGLWTCTFEGCRKTVLQAATEDGQGRVKQHLKTHLTDTQEKIDLALDESRPYLPVANLVRRLQAYGPPSGQEPGPESIERTFSAPIRRRY